MADHPEMKHVLKAYMAIDEKEAPVFKRYMREMVMKMMAGNNENHEMMQVIRQHEDKKNAGQRKQSG